MKNVIIRRKYEKLLSLINLKASDYLLHILEELRIQKLQHYVAPITELSDSELQILKTCEINYSVGRNSILFTW